MLVPWVWDVIFWLCGPFSKKTWMCRILHAFTTLLWWRAQFATVYKSYKQGKWETEGRTMKNTMLEKIQGKHYKGSKISNEEHGNGRCYFVITHNWWCNCSYLLFYCMLTSVSPTGSSGGAVWCLDIEESRIATEIVERMEADSTGCLKS